MTVSTTSSTITVAADGATSYSFPFIGVDPSYILVTYTNSSGSEVTLPPTAYTVTLNAVLTGEVWGIGGTISPISPASYSNGSLTIERVLPLTQEAEISNQGNQYPIVTERAVDVLCMEIQQVSARTGSYRGEWATGNIYNYADITQDGANGGDTQNYYLCANANTSGVWATDLANGYWVLIIPSVIPEATLPLSIGNGGTGATTAGQALNNLGGIALSGNNTFTGSNTFSGATTVPTRISGDNSTNAASTAFVATSFAVLASPIFTGMPQAPTGTAGTGGTQIATQQYADSSVIASAIGISQNWTDVTSSRVTGTTYTNSTGKPIQVLISLNMGTAGNAFISLNGLSVDVAGHSAAGAVVRTPVSFIVPNGQTYALSTLTNSSIDQWVELR